MSEREEDVVFYDQPACEHQWRDAEGEERAHNCKGECRCKIIICSKCEQRRRTEGE